MQFYKKNQHRLCIPENPCIHNRKPILIHMHYTFLLLALFGVLYTPTTPETVTFPIAVHDVSTGKPIVDATLVFSKNLEKMGEWRTDASGNTTADLPFGDYTLEVTATGFQNVRLYETPVAENLKLTIKLDALNDGAAQTSVLLFSSARMQGKVLQGNTSIDDVAEEPLIDDGTIRYDTVVVFDPETYEEKVKVVRRESAVVTESTVTTLSGTASAKKISTKETYGAKIESESAKPLVAADEKREVASELSVADHVSLDGALPPPSGKPGPSEPAPAAGILTAGEWNELHNWHTHWLGQLADGETDAHQNTYHFFPRHRYPVLISNRDEVPLPDVPVQLLGAGGEVVWEARTDNNGQAELWANLFEATTAIPTGLRIRARVDNRWTDLGAADSNLNRFRIKQNCEPLSRVDILWVVDATGSMGDEIRFLKSELLDVISRVKTGNPGLDLRMGSVFYRDRSDEYITRSSALDSDIRKTLDFINKQSAGGGGDTPEAVHSALEEAIERQPWSTEALARICFLVLDASPHQNPEVIASLQRSIRLAAQKGIRIVPVSASGIVKDTEYLMKFFGMATNGTYVFLTNHSGVGGSHIEPDTDTYTVEAFNMLLVRIISEYTRQQRCDGQTAIRFEAGEQEPEQQALYFPNPVADQMTLELPFDAEKVSVYNAEGASVLSLGKLAAGKHTLRLNDLPAGMYTMRIWKGGQVQTGKVMVVRT